MDPYRAQSVSAFMRHAGFAVALSLPALSGAVAAGPHQHGTASLAVALTGNQLQVELTLPARDVVGFERAPRTDEERRKVAAARDRLLDGMALLGPTAEARCTPSKPAEVKSELLAPPPTGQSAHRHGHDEHADFDAVYSLTCADPAALSGLDQTLFKAFPGLKQIRVQAIGAKGPKRVTLTPARTRFAF